MVALGALALGLIPLASGALSNPIVNGDFEDSSTAFAPTSLSVANPATLNTWLTQGHWVFAAGGPPGSSYFAQHTWPGTGSGSTDQLFQAFKLTDTCVSGPGWAMKVQFSYVTENFPSDTLQPSAVVYGFGPAGTWSRFAPWPVTDATLITSQTYPRTNVWTPAGLGPFDPSGYTAIGVGFRFGFQGAVTTQRLEGLDDVEVVVASFPASVNVDPDTLNVGSNGKWITAYFTFPVCGGYSVGDVTDVTLVPGNISGEKFEVVDSTLVVKFDRQALITALGSNTGPTELHFDGQLSDQTGFIASDTINVINP